MYDSDFRIAFKKFNNSKHNFASKCIDYVALKSKFDIASLREQAKIFFSDQPNKIQLLPVPHDINLQILEQDDIFKTKILGKDDVPVSELINSLNNSDWVRQGLEYLNGDKCPFCQQKVTTLIKNELERYFDDAYAQQIKILEEKAYLFNSEISLLIVSLESLGDHNNPLFSYDTVKHIVSAIKAKFDKNIGLINNKKKEPSSIVKLDSIQHELFSILTIIHDINNKITEYNTKIDNLSEERSTLINEIWMFIGSEISSLHQDHLARLKPLNSAIDNMRNKLSEYNTKYTNISAEICDLENRIASITPSKDDINSILSTYGFSNFQIEDDGEGYYKIVRDDGSYAEKTLSEGERTFISFLYFYQLIKGSTSKNDIESPRVLVFDDPVSSLDSKILFIVSTLIRNLFSKSSMKQFNIKQIFIFTHNVYFFKEVSLLASLKSIDSAPFSGNEFSYWIIRKREGVSFVTFYKKNPIKTSYHLLWQEVKNCEKGVINSTTICNVLRRILENYFQLLGGISLTSLVDEFDGDEKLVCRSLTSWIHDGSHSIYDGIEIGIGHDLADHYLPVFKKIFEKTNHVQHYDMMMKTCE